MTKKNWKVELRTSCLICGDPLPNSRYRTYCSKKCREKRNNKVQAGNNTIWQRAKRDAVASQPDPDKVQCLVCGKYYVQVGTHIVQVHGMTARQYREEFDLEVKRGTVPEWYRKEKGEVALANKTFKNLQAGAPYRFTKGQKGIGKYQRSHITTQRLKQLHKSTKGYRKTIMERLKGR